MKIHWEFDENTLGKGKMRKKPPSSTPTQKEKNWGTLNTCRASKQLHAISLSKIIHHDFWLRQMAKAEF
jgi:hypothetical protein